MIFLFCQNFMITFRVTQLLIPWVLGPLPEGIKWPGCEADHSPPTCDKVKYVWSQSGPPPHAFKLRYLITPMNTLTIFTFNVTYPVHIQPQWSATSSCVCVYFFGSVYFNQNANTIWPIAKSSLWQCISRNSGINFFCANYEDNIIAFYYVPTMAD
jgi:hypothetical protein